jgi:hypothetical protein
MRSIIKWFRTRPATKAAWIAAGVAIVALFANTWVIIQNSKSIKATQDMATLMRQANDISYRPFVQIEGLKPEQITEITHNGLNEQNTIGDRRTEGYVVELTPTGKEYLLSGTRNLGQVPAHNIKHSIELFALSSDGSVQRIPHDDKDFLTISETLFPNQSNSQQTPLGNGIVITSDSKTPFVRFKLKITYTGRDVDPNTYYYSVTLKVKTAPTLEALNHLGFGNVAIEQSDEGTEKQSPPNVLTSGGGAPRN